MPATAVALEKRARLRDVSEISVQAVGFEKLGSEVYVVVGVRESRPEQKQIAHSLTTRREEFW